jgi:hypothetical protein
MHGLSSRVLLALVMAARRRVAGERVFVVWTDEGWRVL